MQAEELKKLQQDMDRMGAHRSSLMEKTKAASAALEKSAKMLATFDSAVKVCPDE
jgi:hypothetical protein